VLDWRIGGGIETAPRVQSLPHARCKVAEGTRQELTEMAIRIDVIGCGLALGLAITAWSGAGRAADDGEEINSPPKTTEVAGCHSDQDCKGSRVCDDGKCVADKSLGDSDDEHQKKGVTAFNAIYAELLGPGIIWSVNYERRFGQSGFAARAGLGYVSVTASGGGESAQPALFTLRLVGES
jgi:hypothetical protein